MKQKIYRKPTMEVVQLEHDAMIMLSGGDDRKSSSQSLTDYDWKTVEEE